MKIKRNKFGLYHSGFTLIELLVVIAIIGVLAATSIALINPLQQFKKARDTKRKADLQQIRSALELYRSDNGTYPVSDWVNSQGGANWIPGLAPSYIKTMPTDPQNINSWPWSGGYTYAYQSVTTCGINGGTSYILTARIENSSDPDKNNNIQYGSCSWPAVAGYSGLYTVSSP
jgi:type II secretion system protein G